MQSERNKLQDVDLPVDSGAAIVIETSTVSLQKQLESAGLYLEEDSPTEPFPLFAIPFNPETTRVYAQSTADKIIETFFSNRDALDYFSALEYQVRNVLQPQISEQLSQQVPLENFHIEGGIVKIGRFDYGVAFITLEIDQGVVVFLHDVTTNTLLSFPTLTAQGLDANIGIGKTNRGPVILYTVFNDIEGVFGVDPDDGTLTLNSPSGSEQLVTSFDIPVTPIVQAKTHEREIHLMKGPSDHDEVASSLQDGSSLIILPALYNMPNPPGWIQVVGPNGEVGWINTANIVTTGIDTPPNIEMSVQRPNLDFPEPIPTEIPPRVPSELMGKPIIDLTETDGIREYSPGIYYLPQAQDVRIAGIIKEVFRGGGLLPNDDNIWYLKLDMGNNVTRTMVLGEENFRMGVIETDIGINGNPTIGWSYTAKSYTTSEMLEYFRNSIGLMLITEYFPSYISTADAYKNNPSGCDDICNRILEVFEQTDSRRIYNEIVSTNGHGNVPDGLMTAYMFILSDPNNLLRRYP